MDSCAVNFYVFLWFQIENFERKANVKKILSALDK